MEQKIILLRTRIRYSIHIETRGGTMKFVSKKK